MRAALVVVEVALSVVLLCGAGLLIRSFVALHNVALGFRPEHVLVMESSVPASDLEGSRRATRFYKDLIGDLAMLPGVSAVGATRNPPGNVLSEGTYFIDHLRQVRGHRTASGFLSDDAGRAWPRWASRSSAGATSTNPTATMHPLPP